LGIKLTDMLVKQLGGDLVWHIEGGATFSITLPSSNAKE
jgi:two-component sensor histidine kinase